MINFWSILENQKISEAYRSMCSINEGIKTRNTLKAYPTRPIDIFNNRIPKSKTFDDSDVIETLTVPSSMFSLKSNSDIQIAFTDNGKAKLTFEYDGEELDILSQKIYDTIQSHTADKNKLINIMNDPQLYQDSVVTNEELDFFDDCCKLNDEQRDNINSWINMSNLIFCPTVIDVIRIYDENGKDEIPLSILTGCDNVDNSLNDYIMTESYTNGELLAAKILHSKHTVKGSDTTDYYYNVKPNRANIIRNVMNRDVGEPCFIFNSNPCQHAVDGLTIITNFGVAVAFKDENGSNCISAYFLSPTEVIDQINRWGNRINNSTIWGTSHTIETIPTSLLKHCIFNEINGYCGIDDIKKYRTNDKNSRRYIELYDKK